MNETLQSLPLSIPDVYQAVIEKGKRKIVCEYYLFGELQHNGLWLNSVLYQEMGGNFLSSENTHLCTHSYQRSTLAKYKLHDGVQLNGDRNKEDRYAGCETTVAATKLFCGCG